MYLRANPALFIILFVGNFLLFSGSFRIQAQEQKTETTVNEMIEQHRYQEAIQKLSGKPADKNTKYLLGSLHLKMGNLSEAIPFLEETTPRMGEKGALELAKAYYLSYQFDKSEEQLKKYFKLLRRKSQPAEEAKALGKRLQLATKFLDNTERITVVDSTVVPKKYFINNISFHKGDGSLAIQNKEDKPIFTSRFVNGHNSYALFAANDGDSITSNQNIYRQSFIGNEWSEPQAIDALNTAENENFPILKQDGLTLIFARESTEGLGGYDLYMTRRNLNDESFLSPTLMGMPYNSPYNDYLLAYDEVKNRGALVSDRFCHPDSVCIYTFIPNESNTPIATDNRDIKRLWASWLSIAATQEAGEMKYNETNEKKKDKEDFSFVLGQGKTYTQWSDFKSSKAKNLFKQLQELNEHKDLISSNLDFLRTEYNNAPAAKKETMRSNILQREIQLDKIRVQYDLLLKEIRNTELSNDNNEKNNE